MRSPGPASLLAAISSLSRLAHLPTVISNCLAGWWLGGGGNMNHFLFVVAGALLVFLGGAFLNDAFDVTFDRQHRRGRPIPSRVIGLRAVWKSGLLLLLAGALVLQWPGRATGGLALALVLLVILHDLLHRLFSSIPVLLGTCRLLLYALGASVAVQGVTGWSLWCGIAIACYTTGLELMAGSPHSRFYPARWTSLLLFAPVVLAGFMNTGPYIPSALVLGVLFIGCLLWSLRRLASVPHAGSGHSGALMLPAMVLADMLAACVSRVPPWQASRPIWDLYGMFLSLCFLTLLAVHFEERAKAKHLAFQT